MGLTDVPWDIFRDVAYTFRVNFATYPRPDAQFRIEGMSADELKALFRKEHFDDNNLTSYYKGEDYGLARPEYIPDEWEWYQTHVRIYESRPDKGNVYCELDSHLELDPTPDGYSKPHIKGVNFSPKKGADNVEEVLSRLEIPYERLDN